MVPGKGVESQFSRLALNLTGGELCLETAADCGFDCGVEFGFGLHVPVKASVSTRLANGSSYKHPGK